MVGEQRQLQWHQAMWNSTCFFSSVCRCIPLPSLSILYPAFFSTLLLSLCASLPLCPLASHPAPATPCLPCFFVLLGCICYANLSLADIHFDYGRVQCAHVTAGYC
ncbi:hypothetical protein BDL97_09G001800 [Sphagnum fallax]|nr:hypothetical protein BDL97_09G001800 [Sphagnum fallax]